MSAKGKDEEALVDRRHFLELAVDAHIPSIQIFVLKDDAASPGYTASQESVYQRGKALLSSLEKTLVLDLLQLTQSVCNKVALSLFLPFPSLVLITSLMLLGVWRAGAHYSCGRRRLLVPLSEDQLLVPCTCAAVVPCRARSLHRLQQQHY